MNKGADYEVILGWNNLRNTAKANKDTDKIELSIRFLNYLKR